MREMNNSRQRFLYIHSIPKTGEIFYVGMGTYYPEHKSFKKKFYRAFNTYEGHRSKEWLEFYYKNNKHIEIQILKIGNYEEISELETTLIQYFGRINLQTGNLLNNSDGAFTNESNKVLSEEWKKNISKRHWGRGKFGDKNHFYGEKHTEETKNKMRGPRESITGDKHFRSKVMLNTETGIFYPSIREAAESINMIYSTFKNKLNGKLKNNTDFIKL